MKKIGVKTGLLFALLGACAVGCDGGSGNKTDAKADAKDAGTDNKADSAVPDATADMTPAMDMVVQPDMAAPDMATPDAAVDMAAPDMTTNPDVAVDMAAPDMTTTPDAAMDVPMDTAPDGTTMPDGSTDGAVTHTIGGTVTGLQGTGAVLRNGTENLPLTPGATSFPFVFTTRLAAGATYNVTVQTQPSTPTQVCTVTNGSGTVGAANVSNVTVTCVTQSFTIGGSVSGLVGTGLVLHRNDGTNLPVTAGATSYMFAAQASGTAYAVTVETQPANQICTIANASGTVGGANVTNVNVTCATQVFTVGGSISGLTAAGLVLRNNGGDNLTVAANATSFTFATSLATGSAYAVTVFTQPTGQACSVNTGTGSGTVGSANVTTVAITCVSTYTVGGTISGLTGTGLVLQNNGGDNLTVAANATSFTFGTRLANGAMYNVTVLTQPGSPTQVCTVASPTGTVSGANVSVAVTCQTRYTVGGTISGLTASGLILRNSGGDDLTVPSGATTFTFATPLATGVMYNVTVQASPSTSLVCAVMSGGTGTIATANVNTVAIQCTPRYSLGGTISGLTGSGLVLRNAGVDLAVAANATTFTFPAPFLASGTTYNVSIQTQPSGVTCAFMGTTNMGTVASANVNTVVLQCSTPSPLCFAGDQGSVVTLTCPNAGQNISAITFSSFGQPTGTCPGPFTQSATCHATTSTSAIQGMCVGQHSCTFTADFVLFAPDPCPGMAKSYAVTATCN